MHFRLCDSSDLAAIVEFELSIGNDEATSESVSEFLKHPAAVLVGAWADLSLVGAARLYVLREIEAIGPMMLLFEIDVLKGYRRQGIAAGLMRSVDQIARDQGCREVWVVTEDDNEPARKLYERAGYQCRAIGDRVYWRDLDEVEDSP